MKTILKRNHRLFNYQEEFGSTTEFMPTLLVDAGFLDIEAAGSVNCTCFTADNIVSAFTGVKYDHTWLWSQILQSGKGSSFGASPQDAFNIAVQGLRNILTGEITKPVVAYFQVETGQYDYFTNVKSVMQMEYNKGFKRPVGCGTVFYYSWVINPDNAVLPAGSGNTTNHEWEVCGWDDTTHPNCFLINWWGGRKNWMTQEDFNKAMDKTYGSVALTFAQTTQEKIDFIKQQNYSRIQAIIDAVYNLFKTLQSMLLSNQTIDTPTLDKTVNDTYNKIEDQIKHMDVDTLSAWDTSKNCEHNVRALCDIKGLNPKDKDIIQACVNQESGFMNYKPDGTPVIHQNLNKDGSVSSTDWGIAQINDHYHIGPTLDFPSVDFVLSNPQKCIEFMIDCYKIGNLGLWSSYKTGAYKKYLKLV